MNETNIATTLELNGTLGNVKVSKLFMLCVLKWIQLTFKWAVEQLTYGVKNLQ